MKSKMDSRGLFVNSISKRICFKESHMLPNTDQRTYLDLDCHVSRYIHLLETIMLTERFTGPAIVGEHVKIPFVDGFTEKNSNCSQENKP